MQTTRLLPLAAVAALAVSVGATTSAAAAVTHTVQRGETLTSVAAADGLSVDQLAAANGLAPTADLIRGQSLVIPPRSQSVAAPSPSAAGAGATAAPTASSTSSAGYLVQPGDTLDAIAARFGTTAGALAAANGLAVNGLLLAGSTLSVSGAPAASAATTASASTESPAPASTVAPSDESVSPSDVGAIAAENGVPAALAEAVADQESGFNNAMVSPTGATGVMQIEPATWADLSREGLQLAPNSASDNIRGGVAILRRLLAQTGGDQAQAAAAYYQGLRSLREHGMYPSTRRYVRSVQALEARFGG